MAKNKPFSDQLRDALMKCGRTRYSIAMETGLSQGNLSRFVHGDAGMSLENIDLLVEAIGARLTTGAPTKKKTAKKRSQS